VANLSATSAPKIQFGIEPIDLTRVVEIEAIENFVSSAWMGVSFCYIFVVISPNNLSPDVSTEELVENHKLGRTRALLAAKHLFATQGFNETTTLAIARVADVSHSFLLNQFGNKDRLLVEVLDTGWSPIVKRVRALCRTQTPQRRLNRALELLLDSWLKDPEAAELMLLEGRRVREGASIIAASAGFANCLGIFDHYVAECRTSGTWPDKIGNAAIRSGLLALVEGLFLNGRLYLRNGFPIPPTTDEAQELISVFINGLCLQREKPHPFPSS
jgi:AcrR family transcriptional regulator